ncbi:MAG: GNAT family N-acetyltransferase [Candidatus Binatia bacterium]
MADHRVTIRRGRRTDFTAVMELLAEEGVPLPPADRTTLRRFRRLVADLGTDFYVAVIDGRIEGLVHVTYARQLTQGATATLERLVVAEACGDNGIGMALLRFAQRRARNRGCARFSCALPASAHDRREFLERSGLEAHGEWLAVYWTAARASEPAPAKG